MSFLRKVFGKRDRQAPSRGLDPARGDALERRVRVFVSSTFLDMRAEREALAKWVFPQIRKMCQSRGVSFADVDLRWGITDEQAAEGGVLPICLNEIERSRPYFIGVIGERYGWVPTEIPAELAGREPWLAQHDGRSVTELEILHGVLNSPEMSGHALFYFRSREFLATLPAGEREQYDELPRAEDVAAFGMAEAVRRAEDRAARLARLKDRIRRSGAPVREDYPDPTAFRALVLADLTRVIDARFPERAVPDPIARARAEHYGYAEERATVYVARDHDFARLDAHAADEGPPLVVRGAPGSGKSALLGNWLLRVSHAGHSALPRIAHFVAAGGGSASVPALLQRVMQELQRTFGLHDALPQAPTELSAAFRTLLHRVAARGRVILIIDGLDELEDRAGARDLTWLPSQVPPGIRLIVSAGSGRALDVLNQRGWSTLDVEPLTQEERERLTSAYLGRYSKSLPDSERRRIARAPQTERPLFLRLLLEELRLHGDHQTLREQVDGYLAAATTPALFDRILARYEADYERGRSTLVRDAMSLISASRRGLSEAELLLLLGSNGEPLPHAFWSPLHLAAEHVFLQQSGRLTFAHDDLRRAVESRYLPSESQRTAVHIRLADHFIAGAVDQRSIEEAPWQLAKAKAWDRLKTLLAVPAFLEPAWAAGAWDVRAYWTELEANSGHRLVDAYRPVIDGPIENHVHAWSVGQLLEGAKEVGAARHLQGRLIDHFRASGNHGLLAGALGNMASLLMDSGALAPAFPLLEEQERLARASDDRRLLGHCLNSRARALTLRGDRDGAATLLGEAIAIGREDSDPHYLAYYLGNLAALVADGGDPLRALPLLKEQERICRELADPDGLALALVNTARALSMTGDMDGAEARLADLESVCRPIGLIEPLGRAYAMRTEMARARGDDEAALGFLNEEAALCNQLGDGAGVVRSLLTQTSILHDRGAHEAAVERCRVAERIARDLPDQTAHRATLTCLQMSLGGLAIRTRDAGRVDEALGLLQEQERICRSIDDKDGLQKALGDQANILHRKGDAVGALRLHDEEEQLCRDIGDHNGLQGAIGNRGAVLMTMGRVDEALELFREKARLCREMQQARGLASALDNEAVALWTLGRRDEALAAAEEAWRIAEAANLGDRGLMIRARLLDLRGRMSQGNRG